MSKNSKIGQLAKVAKPQTVSEVMSSILDGNNIMESYVVTSQQLDLATAKILFPEYHETLVMIEDGMWKSDVVLTDFIEQDFKAAKHIADSLKALHPDFEFTLAQLNYSVQPPQLAIQIIVYGDDEDGDYTRLFTTFLVII